MRLLATTLQALCTVLLLSTPACTGQQTDYDRELAEIQASIDGAGSNVFVGAADQGEATKLIYYFYRRAALTGDMLHFKTAENAIRAAVKDFGETEQLLLFRVDLNFKLHRPEAVKQDLQQLARISKHPRISELYADLALQQGQYPSALSQYNALLQHNRNWRNLARLAWYQGKTGKPEQADRLYHEAQDQLSVKEMRHYAWLELQRGLLDLDSQRYPEALAHYKKADQAYSGYWLIQEHIAEVQALLGDTAEAVERYRAVIKKAPHPDLIGALASLVDDPAEKAALYKRADDLFARNLKLFREATGGHVIQHLLTREKTDPHLLEYAQQNHQLRPNAEAKLLLAKVWLRLNNVTAAKQLLQEIAQTPWQTRSLTMFTQQLAAQEKTPRTDMGKSSL